MTKENIDMALVAVLSLNMYGWERGLYLESEDATAFITALHRRDARLLEAISYIFRNDAPIGVSIINTKATKLHNTFAEGLLEIVDALYSDSEFNPNDFVSLTISKSDNHFNTKNKSYYFRVRANVENERLGSVMYHAPKLTDFL